MKAVKKFKLNKNAVALISLLGVFVILLAAYFIVSAIKSSQEGGEQGNGEKPEIMEGEDYYLNQLIAYPRLEEKNILSILVKNEKGTFDLTRWPDDNGCFWLGYNDGEGGVDQMIQYIPPIVDAEGNFSYESLYAVDMNDGYGRVYMLTYLCSAIGTPYFSYRIELPTGTDAESVRERELMLEEYGFAAGEAEYVAFAYGDRDKNGNVTERGTHMLTIGDRALSGSGYYYMVDERDYIYFAANNSLEYATLGFEAFVKGMLVAEGVEGDSTYEPYLTTDFKQWVLNQHDKDGEKVTEGSLVVSRGDIFTPIIKGADYIPSAGEDGYERGEDETLTFDLATLKSRSDFKRISAMLQGREVGKEESFLLTLISEIYESDGFAISFGEGTELAYTYTVTEIESVLTETGEYTEAGHPVAGCESVKIAYTLSVGGVSQGSLTRHAILPFDSELLDDATKAALGASTVGKLNTPLSFTIDYTKENAPSCREEVYVSDIIGIFDKEGASLSKITDSAVVSFRYYEVINGVKGDKVLVNIKMETMKDDPKWAPFRTALLDKSRGEDLDIPVYSETYYYELVRDFVSCSVECVEYFVDSELTVSFRFQNASNRDPFYGESFFENTMTNQYKLYGLNAGACEEVVKALGGIDDDSSASLGISGETVALGLTHENMDKYGLYAYKIYFELPRGIYDRTEGTEDDGDDVLSDFGWYNTLGFTLYVSEEDPATGKRYVGSDMYDLVALVDGEKFEFLKHSFVDMYARRDVVLMNVANLKELKLDLRMEDLHGSFAFDLSHREMYVGYKNGKLVSSSTYFEGSTATDKYYISATASEGATETELGKYLDRHNTDSASLTDLYNEVVGKGEEMFVPGSIETLGVSYFMEAFEGLQLTRFQGSLTAEEQQRAYAEGELIMRMQLLLQGKNASAYYYNYDFYRFEDRRIMVAIYQSDENGNRKSTEVSSLYMSTFTFRRMVEGWVSVLNAEEFDNDIAYPDEQKNKQD